MHHIADGEHAGLTFTGAQQAGERFTHAAFEGCVFRDCVLTGANFANARFVDCSFVGCELSMLVVAGASLVQSRFVDCRAMGIQWASAHSSTFSASFERCNLDSGVFSGMKLKGISMVGCRLDGVDFTGCDLSGARFTESDLGGANLRHANVRSADFAEARGFVFDQRTNKAGKTRINLETAAQVLASIGLVVPDLDQILGR